ncbi:hypothetical protein CDEF62S_02385 [Castellaniella defragrans]
MGIFATEKEKEEKQFEKVLSSIKTMGEYDKEVFTQLLATNEYIILPEVAIEEEKIPLCKITWKKSGDMKRDRNLTINMGEKPQDFTRFKKGSWAMAKTEGKDFVINHLTEQGKAHYKTEEGKAEIDSWFLP